VSIECAAGWSAVPHRWVGMRVRNGPQPGVQRTGTVHGKRLELSNAGGALPVRDVSRDVRGRSRRHRLLAGRPRLLLRGGPVQLREDIPRQDVADVAMRDACERLSRAPTSSGIVVLGRQPEVRLRSVCRGHRHGVPARLLAASIRRLSALERSSRVLVCANRGDRS